jgi:hypothetical protein
LGVLSDKKIRNEFFMKGAKILIESLLKENVEVIFGYPGGAV